MSPRNLGKWYNFHYGATSFATIIEFYSILGLIDNLGNSCSSLTISSSIEEKYVIYLFWIAMTIVVWYVVSYILHFDYRVAWEKEEDYVRMELKNFFVWIVLLVL